jgi:CRP-like cAMP-binding protein
MPSAELLAPRSRRSKVEYALLKKALRKEPTERSSQEITAVDAFLIGTPRILMPVDSANMRLRLGSGLQAEEFQAGQVILSEGRDLDAARVYVIHTGTVHIRGMAPKDMQQAQASEGPLPDENRTGLIHAPQDVAKGITHSLGPGELFGVAHLPAPAYSAVAKTAVKLCWISRRQLARMMQAAFEEAVRSNQWVKQKDGSSPRGLRELGKLSTPSADFGVSDRTSQMVSEDSKMRLQDIGKQLSEISMAERDAATRNKVDILLAVASGGVRADAVSTLLSRVPIFRGWRPESLIELAWAGQLLTVESSARLPEACGKTIRFVLEGSVSIDYGQFVSHVATGSFFGDEGLGMADGFEKEVQKEAAAQIRSAADAHRDDAGGAHFQPDFGMVAGSMRSALTAVTGRDPRAGSDGATLLGFSHAEFLALCDVQTVGRLSALSKFGQERRLARRHRRKQLRNKLHAATDKLRLGGFVLNEVDVDAAAAGGKRVGWEADRVINDRASNRPAVTVDERQVRLLMSVADEPGKSSWLSRHTDGNCDCFPKCDPKPVEDDDGFVFYKELIPRRRRDAIQSRLHDYVNAGDTSTAASSQLGKDLVELSGVGFSDHGEGARLDLNLDNVTNTDIGSLVTTRGAQQESMVAGSTRRARWSLEYLANADLLAVLTADYRELRALINSSFVLLESTPLAELQVAQDLARVFSDYLLEHLLQPLNTRVVKRGGPTAPSAVGWKASGAAAGQKELLLQLEGLIEYTARQLEAVRFCCDSLGEAIPWHTSSEHRKVYDELARILEDIKGHGGEEDGSTPCGLHGQLMHSDLTISIEI